MEDILPHNPPPITHPPSATTHHPLLQVVHLKKYFPIVGGVFSRTRGYVRAVDDVSFDLAAGECLGLVGESGSGKTTVGRAILRALIPTSGEIWFQPKQSAVSLPSAAGAEDGVRPQRKDIKGSDPIFRSGGPVNLAALSEHGLRPFRRHMQMIFQDPYSSLNPRMTVFDIIGEPLLVNGMRRRREREARVRVLLHQVGLRPHHLHRYPHAFSGGQRQRIGIARALALSPQLIVADEPVSALDVSVQAQILNLLQALRTELGLAYLLVAHDLSVVRHISDRVAVMYVGRLVEVAATADLFAAPAHPYTEALLSAAPVADPTRPPRRIILTGEPADPAAPPPGCHFHPRCRYADDRCRFDAPELRPLGDGRLVRCHYAEKVREAGRQVVLPSAPGA